MGQLHGAVVPLVGEGDVYLGRDRQGDLSVDGGHGVVALGAGFVDAVLNGDAKRNAAVSEKVTVDAADDVIAHTFRVADGLVNGGRAVGCARGLDHDGVDIAVGAELEGVTLHPPGGGMLGYGVDISQTIGEGLRGGQPTGPSRGLEGRALRPEALPQLVLTEIGLRVSWELLCCNNNVDRAERRL